MNAKLLQNVQEDLPWRVGGRVGQHWRSWPMHLHLRSGLATDSTLELKERHLRRQWQLRLWLQWQLRLHGRVALAELRRLPLVERAL